MTKKKLLIPIILMILMLSVVTVGHAQGPAPLTAQVDRTELSTDEMLTLTVSLNAAVLSAPRPSLPSLEGFQVVGSSSSSQISMVNGNVSSQILYLYRLQPYQTGNLVIEPIQVTLNGQTFSTEPISVHVTQGTGTLRSAPAAPAVPTVPAAPQAAAPPSGQQAPLGLSGQDLFVEAVVDNPTPYVGEQVVYTFRFYQAVNLWDQPQYEAPSFQGFWNEHQSDRQEYRVQVSNRIYQVTEMRDVLFPSVVGPVTIDTARLLIPGGLLRSGKTLQTRPVALDVLPLPPNAPEGFSGAVGQYTLDASVDAQPGAVNEPLTWRVTLTGWGNITAAPDPDWPEMPGWRGFESEATVHTEIQQGQAAGSRVYERLLVPSAGGEFTIPALTYVYFDPSAGTYQTLSTEPVPVSITGDAGSAATTIPVANAGAPVEQVSTDIRHLKPVPSELVPTEQPMTKSGLYWAAWVFPLLGAAGYFAWQRRQRYWEKNLGLARSSNAQKKARKALAQARRQKENDTSTAGQILTTYLADKLGQPVAGLTHQSLAELLNQRAITPDLIERVEVCLVSSELGRFAPGADSPDHAKSLLKEVDILIAALEKAL